MINFQVPQPFFGKTICSFPNCCEESPDSRWWEWTCSFPNHGTRFSMTKAFPKSCQLKFPAFSQKWFSMTTLPFGTTISLRWWFFLFPRWDLWPFPVGYCITQGFNLPSVEVARRVAAERGEDLGGSVGYAVRFDAVWRAQGWRWIACDPVLKGNFPTSKLWDFVGGMC